MSAQRHLEPATATVEQSERRAHVALQAADDIPAVCFIEDLVRILGTSRRTIERMRRRHVFPIPELPVLDRKARWSGAVVRRWLEGESMSRSWRRA